MAAGDVKQHVPHQAAGCPGFAERKFAQLLVELAAQQLERRPVGGGFLCERINKGTGNPPESFLRRRFLCAHDSVERCAHCLQAIVTAGFQPFEQGRLKQRPLSGCDRNCSLIIRCFILRFKLHRGIRLDEVARHTDIGVWEKQLLRLYGFALQSGQFLQCRQQR